MKYKPIIAVFQDCENTSATQALNINLRLLCKNMALNQTRANMFKVFVYGSLKRNFPNHHLLIGQTYLGTFVTEQAIYEMKNFGIYPGVVSTGNKSVRGELYEVDHECLRNLDELEENGKIYQRKLVQLTHYPEPCWMYFLIKKSPVFKETNEQFQVQVLDDSSSLVAEWLIA